MQLYNSLTRQKEEFTPLNPGKVGLYACGITAYDYCHIGHARSAIVFDVLVRYLRHMGNQVTFVRNFTDVDDKIIARANADGVSSESIAERFIAAFHEDMDRLGVTRADVEPKATEYIGEMARLAERLLLAAADGDGFAPAATQARQLLAVWPQPSLGTRPGRVHAALVRGRLARLERALTQ